MDQRYGTEVWNRGMMRYGTDPSRRYGTGYGTGVWNGCGPGACSGPPILTCPHLSIYCVTSKRAPTNVRKTKELLQIPARYHTRENNVETYGLDTFRRLAMFHLFRGHCMSARQHVHICKN